MRNLEEIKKIINEHKPILEERFKVNSIGIFGSYETIDLFDFVELENFLREILSVKVDVVMKETLKPRIKDRILKEAVYI
jgi:predicted nucleotidyltransferase